MGAVRRLKMTYAEYVAAEAKSEVKHEYLRGDVWAMAGGTIEHGRLQANLIYELRRALGGRPCRVLTSDVRVRIEATDRATYPDVSVVCGKMEVASDDPHGLANPTLLIEVLSDGSEHEDRFDKFAHYRRIPSLREYVLVSQKTRRIEVYRREGDFWLLSEAGAGGAVELRSIECRIAVDDVYADPAAGA